MLHEELRPFESPLDFDAAAHLWRRAGFGAPLSTVEATARKSAAEAASALVRGPDADPAIDDLESIRGAVIGANSVDGARAWLLARMVRSAHPLREKLALFWHGHFATSIAKVRDLAWMMRQYQLFLEYGLGPFPVLLDHVTRDPAMIRWLDNETNSKGQPNENFARELFELFTLGIGNYTERDIQEAGRAFTGWHILRGKFHFSRSQHDEGEKQVLGRSGPFGGEEVLALALEQEACGRFLARKLLVYFVEPDPRPEIVASLGACLRDSGYDVARTLEVLLGSRLFFSPRIRRALIKSPLDFVVGAARVYRAKLDTQPAVVGLREMGQELLAPPNVKGWPGHRHWINTASWLARVNAAGPLAKACDEAATLTSFGDRSRALLGRPVPEPERATLAEAGGLRALLSLPEAHLA